MYSNFKALC